MALAASARWPSSRPDLGGVVGVGSVVAFAAVSGLLIARFGALGALFPTIVLGLALTWYWIEVIPVAALLSVFVTTRVPGLAQSVGISISDILVTLATALVVTRLRFTRPVLRALAVVGVYELALLAPVIVSGTRASYVEWLHRGELVGGAILCGALIAQRGRALVALRLVAAVAGFYSLAAIDAYVRTREAAYVFTLQKNGLGTLLMMVLLLALFIPDLVPGRWRWAYCGLIVGGIFASQSRGAMVGATVGFLVAGVVDHRRLLRSPLVLLLAASSLLYVYLNVQETQSTYTPAGIRFSAVGSRAIYRDESLAVWHRSPVTGAGLKLFNEPGSGLSGEPHNYIFLALAEGGLFSLAGVIWLQLGVLETLRRQRSVWGLAAMAVIVGRATHGLFDIYWLGGTGSLCWFLAGIALGEPGASRPGLRAAARSATASTRPGLPLVLPPPPSRPPAPQAARALVTPAAEVIGPPGGTASLPNGPSSQATARPSESRPRAVQVLVVAFGQAALLEEAIEGVATLPVVVVDNSSDRRVEEVARRHGALYLNTGRNLGFAAGVNRGLLEIPAHCDVLLLNPDARLDAADVTRLQERLHRGGARLAAVAPVQRDGAGHLQRVEWPVPSPRLMWYEAFGLLRLPGFRPRGRQFLTGSLLLLNADALAQVGPFDERFFLYSEETDWQRRAFELGWDVEMVGTVTGFHLGAATSTNEHVRELHFHASGERFVRKWYGDGGWSRYRAAVIVGAILRSIVLGGDAAAQARRRAKIFLRGPVKAERRRVPR